MRFRLSQSGWGVSTLLALILAVTPAGVRAAPALAGTAWGSDLDKDCFVIGIELYRNGKAELAASTMDVLSGKWTLSGATLKATFYLDEKHPPLVFSGEVKGDIMKASYTWNEGSDAGPDHEECEFRRVKKKG